MDRRAFLRRAVVSAAGLYVAPDLLEETRRRIFPVGIDLRTPPPPPPSLPAGLSPMRQLRLTWTDMGGCRHTELVPLMDNGDGSYTGKLPDPVCQGMTLHTSEFAAVDFVGRPGRIEVTAHEFADVALPAQVRFDAPPRSFQFRMQGDDRPDIPLTFRPTSRAVVGLAPPDQYEFGDARRALMVPKVMRAPGAVSVRSSLSPEIVRALDCIDLSGNRLLREGSDLV